MAQHLAQSNNSSSNETDFHFNGFKSLNSTPIPDEFFDVLAVKLSEAELRVLLYIMRRTFGFKKTADAISLSQLTDGIRKRDGAVLDYGTGLSRPSVLKAVSGLKAKGIITVEKRTGYDGRNEVNVYALRFQAETARNEPSVPTSYTQQYSTAEYSINGQTFFPTPDPQFVSAQPSASIPGAIRAEQRRSGDTTSQQIIQEVTGKGNNDSKGNYLPTSDNTARVNSLNQQGKGSLPIPANRTKQGKAALPGQLTKKDYGSKAQHTEGVNLINLQENSLQKIREQETAQQRLLLANGALALQEFMPEPHQELAQEEMVEVEIDGDLLYINFRKLVLALVELGLSEKLSYDLAYAYPEAYLWEKIALTRQQVARSSHQRTLRNTAGYLRRAIEEDYQPSATPSKQAAGSSGAALRFPHAQALVNPAPTAFDETNPVYPPEDTAPLPPIYRTDHRLSAVPEERYNSWSQARSVGSSGGAEEGRAFAPPTSPPAIYNSPYNPYNEEPYVTPSDFQSPPPAAVSRKQEGPDPDVYAELWQAVCEDLAGRYRLGAILNLLEGSWLWLSQEANLAVAIIVLASPWQLHELGLAARSAINMALRQQLGPGYITRFEHF